MLAAETNTDLDKITIKLRREFASLLNNVRTSDEVRCATSEKNVAECIEECNERDLYCRCGETLGLSEKLGDLRYK